MEPDKRNKQKIAFKKWYSKIKNKVTVKRRVAKQLDFKRFGGQRQFILERDNFSCQDCGMSQEQHILIFNKGLTIDHIDGRGRNSKKPNNNPDNMRTLCLRCHGIKDRKRRSK